MSTERDAAYHTIFVTALEGGVNYWATCSEYRWSKRSPDGVGRVDDVLGFKAVIHDEEDPGSPGLTVNRAVIAKGVGLFVKEYLTAVKMPYFQQAATCLRYGKWDDLDVDADIADVIVQFGLFGEVFYG